MSKLLAGGVYYIIMGKVKEISIKSDFNLNAWNTKLISDAAKATQFNFLPWFIDDLLIFVKASSAKGSCLRCQFQWWTFGSHHACRFPVAELRSLPDASFLSHDRVRGVRGVSGSGFFLQEILRNWEQLTVAAQIRRPWGGHCATATTAWSSHLV